MVFSAGGILMFFSPLSEKQYFPRYSNPFGSSIAFRFLHSMNAQYSILFSVDGSLTLSSALS